MKQIYLADRFGEQEYIVNGVRYIVGACFQSSKVPVSNTLHDRMKRIVSGNTVPLSIVEPDATIEPEYVCSAAGKEET